MYVNIYVHAYTRELWVRDELGGVSSLSTMWVLGIELRLSDLMANIFAR